METIQVWLIEQGVSGRWAPDLARFLAVTLVVLLAAGAHLIVQGLVIGWLQKAITKTKTRWDDALKQSGFLKRLGYLVPFLIVFRLADWAMSGWEAWIGFVLIGCKLVFLGIGIVAVDALLNAVQAVYQEFRSAREIPIKGFVQGIKIVIVFVGLIVAVAILANQEVLVVLSGLGALTAVLMFIFKDAILGFIAGIQLTANRMVAHGDWVEMPHYGADGVVVDIALTTVKVQNWDKTVTAIPTYALISESFKNWRGMTESGGRRIMRSVYIDVQSIAFCTEEMLQRFAKIQYISDYIEGKKKEIAEYNAELKVDESVRVNGRHLTNIGTFRAYVAAYLRHHSMIHQEMTFLVRQLQPTEHGLPIQIYVFCKDTAWANYETIQADIFDHILAVVPEFDLRVFQAPSGRDFRQWSGVQGA